MSKNPTNPPKARVTPLDKIVGDMVRSLREAKGESQDVTSEAMKISKTLLSQLEAGNRAWNSTTMTAASKHFKVGIAELVGGSTLSSEDQKDLDLIRALREAKDKAGKTD